jgi:hypothetical protein
MSGEELSGEGDPPGIDRRTERIGIETERHRIEGVLTLARDGYRSRVSDVLNASERDFITLTDVTVAPLDGGPIDRAASVPEPRSPAHRVRRRRSGYAVSVVLADIGDTRDLHIDLARVGRRQDHPARRCDDRAAAAAQPISRVDDPIHNLLDLLRDLELRLVKQDARHVDSFLRARIIALFPTYQLNNACYRQTERLSGVQIDMRGVRAPPGWVRA